MATTSTLLCIHRNSTQLGLLPENGYELLTARNGHDGLRLFMSQPVHAVVLEYNLGLLNGAVVAAEIKQVKPQLPIVMFSEDLELPDDAFKSVDALVVKSDGPHFLWATIHFMLNVKPARYQKGKLNVRTPAPLPRSARSRAAAVGL
jgi:DNA-binding response OmpR family regulator